MTFKVGDKVTIQDHLYEESWDRTEWVVQVRGLVGVVVSMRGIGSHVSWFGLDDPDGETYTWNPKWIKYLGSTTE